MVNGDRQGGSYAGLSTGEKGNLSGIKINSNAVAKSLLQQGHDSGMFLPLPMAIAYLNC